MQADFFFDTYALIAFLEEKESYKKFEDTPIITSFYNIYELTYYIIRDYSREEAKKVLDKLNYNLLKPEEKDLIKASKFKFKNKDRMLSYVDCMGYILAKKHDLRFLTGDKEFEEKNNVEYIK